MKPLRAFESWFYSKFEHDEAPALMRAGHLMPWIASAWAAYSIANDALGEPWDGAWRWTNGIAAAALLYAVLGSVIHGRRLCERCAAHTPLSPEESVARWKPGLRFCHRERLVKASLIAVMAWNLAVYRTVPAHAWWRYAIDIAVVIYICGFVWLAWQHSRLQPWCPWCRWDKGGDKEPSPDVPAPVVSA